MEFLVQMKMEMTVVLVVVHQVVDLLEMVVMDRSGHLMLQVILEKWKYTVITAEDGSDAWRKINSGDHIQIAVLDWEMPEMDGFELMRQMREFNPTIPIIVVSGKTTSGIEADVLSSGASYFLAKPVDTNDLIKTIYRTIHHRVSDLGA